MDQFENDLKQALRQVDPPAGFEQRVLARLARESAATRQPSRFTAWATAAGLAFASLGGVAIYQQQQQRRAMEARDQLLLALRVTSEKLDVVRSRINHSSASDSGLHSNE